MKKENEKVETACALLDEGVSRLEVLMEIFNRISEDESQIDNPAELAKGVWYICNDIRENMLCACESVMECGEMLLDIETQGEEGQA